MKLPISIFSILYWTVTTFAQSSETENVPITVGQPCPNFVLDHIEYFGKPRASLYDFKNKWLVLDFWTKGCVVCVKSFPKINELQKEFSRDIQFLLVAKNDERYNKGIKVLFERYKERYNLNLAIAYDSVLFERFGVQTTPHIVIVDPKGFIRAITYSGDLETTKLKALIEGRPVSFNRKYSVFEKNPSDTVSSSSIFSNDLELIDSEFIYRSVLTKWNRNLPVKILTDLETDKNGVFGVTAMSLYRLYNIAYFGRTDWNFTDSLYGVASSKPILELQDTTDFIFDFNSGRGFYNYSLLVPKSKRYKASLQWAMKCDLRKYFAYDIALQTRLMPCWNLVRYAANTIRQSNPNESSQVYGDHSGYKIINTPVRQILNLIWSYHQAEAPFFDETGISNGIDMNLDAIMTDLNDINRALKDNGLFLVRERRKMKVLVVREIMDFK